MNKNQIEELRIKYIKNPPEGMTAAEIRKMSDEALLDMDYFFNEDDLFADEAGVERLIHLPSLKSLFLSSHKIFLSKPIFSFSMSCHLYNYITIQQ